MQLGNVWIGVQPALGVEGDPMRLLFDRDLTPHPQYAAFYHWLERTFAADAVVHFGMHGTVEWLPGQPLGNSGLSWSDVLLGNMPNVYVYAANNPSESIVAKRRGYGTIISHNVPPYGRAGALLDQPCLCHAPLVCATCLHGKQPCAKLGGEAARLRHHHLTQRAAVRPRRCAARPRSVVQWHVLSGNVSVFLSCVLYGALGCI